MNRIDRLYALVEELQAAGPRGRTARQLAKHFEVNVRTIERDLSALGQAGVPLATKTGRTARAARRDQGGRADAGRRAAPGHGWCHRHGAFTHMAMYQAGIAVRAILGEDGPPADYRAVPLVTFTDPEIGSFGLTEAQARDAGLQVAVGLARVP
jgi:hypothetical protein